MASGNFIKIGSDNDFLPDGTKPLPAQILPGPQRGLLAFIWDQILQENTQNISHYNVFEKLVLKIQATSPRGQWTQPIDLSF